MMCPLCEREMVFRLCNKTLEDIPANRVNICEGCRLRYIRRNEDTYWCIYDGLGRWSILATDKGGIKIGMKRSFDYAEPSKELVAKIDRLRLLV